MALTSGPFTEIALNNVFWKQLEIKGSTMANQSEFRAVMNLVFGGKISPIIDKIFPLEQAKKAEQYLKEANQFGKVLLQI